MRAIELFLKLLYRPGSISTSTGCHVVSVNKTGECISQATFICNDTITKTIQASYVIDASYDGDIMTMAGDIDYVYGREPRSKFNESLAGESLLDETIESFDKQGLSISPYFDNGTLLPYISPDPLQPVGTGDDRCMAYQYFACVSDTVGNRVPFDPPKGYNPDDFILLLRTIEGLVDSGKYPNGPPLGYFGGIQCYNGIVQKTTGNRDCLFCCGDGPVDADQPDLARGWPAANYSRRLEMAEDHRYYLEGLLHFLANDPRVPNGTRASASSYGYCKDEYADYGNWPPQLYVRSSNRLQGMSLLTQNNIVDPRIKPDGVAMGCWEFDQHTMSRRVTTDKKDPTKKVVTNEGFFRNALGADSLSCDHPKADCSNSNNWYDVPFGTMAPKRGQASNLLVPVVISATSVAYASTRIENMFMDMGSAAGVAVAQLLDGGAAAKPGQCPTKAVQDTNITAVQEVLVNVYQQRIHGPPVPFSHHSFDVLGAGSPEWDGNYTATSYMRDGCPIYTNSKNESKALYRYDSIFRLAVLDHEIFYVAGDAVTSCDPPMSGWLVANASAPAPHLVANP